MSAEVRGRTRRYRLDPGGFVPVQRWLVLHGFWSGRLDALTALLDEQPADPEENQA